ncbi:MAG: type II secretion system protein [Verrucomicrobiaceae bacterium]|nr:MAG: type II secretion system protein [Verrucomicrobiaceae bacterium]
MNIHPMKKRHAGFTLVEILVSIAIIAALTSVGVVGFQNAREKSKSVVEVNAARNLISGYILHATDHNGQVLAGYKMDPDATDLDGNLLHNPTNARYPYRLAPSLPQIKGTMFFNGNESLLEGSDGAYIASLRPNMGINANLVGGFYGGETLLDPSAGRLSQLYGKFYVSHMAEVNDPGKLIVFASARDKEKKVGYFQVRPPKMMENVWSSGEFTKDKPATDHGYVDFRFNGKAVVVMIGGNVEMLDEKELRDMRRWSNQASVENDPDFTLRAKR